MSERSLFSTILRPLTTGLLALLPVGLTVAIVAWLVNFLATMVPDYIKKEQPHA